MSDSGRSEYVGIVTLSLGSKLPFQDLSDAKTGTAYVLCLSGPGKAAKCKLLETRELESNESARKFDLFVQKEANPGAFDGLDTAKVIAADMKELPISCSLSTYFSSSCQEPERLGKVIGGFSLRTMSIAYDIVDAVSLEALHIDRTEKVRLGRADNGQELVYRGLYPDYIFCLQDPALQMCQLVEKKFESDTTNAVNLFITPDYAFEFIEKPDRALLIDVSRLGFAVYPNKFPGLTFWPSSENFDNGLLKEIRLT